MRSLSIVTSLISLITLCLIYIVMKTKLRIKEIDFKLRFYLDIGPHPSYVKVKEKSRDDHIVSHVTGDKQKDLIV